MENKHEILRDFFKKNLQAEIDDDINFFDEGYVDSLDSLIIIRFIEKEFQIKVTPDDLINNDLSSINGIVDFVNKKLEK